MTKVDIRWQQRFDNFLKAFDQFDSAVKLSQTRALTDLERQGIIQAFEFTHELAWNVLKDYLEYQGVFNLTGSPDSSREAFQRNLVTRGDDWMEMKSRNLTSHTYNQSIVNELFQQIVSKYQGCFLELKSKMLSLKES